LLTSPNGIGAFGYISTAAATDQELNRHYSRLEKKQSHTAEQDAQSLNGECKNENSLKFANCFNGLGRRTRNFPT